MPLVPRGAPHGTSICLEVRDTTDVVQEGQTVLEELLGPSLNTRCCLIPWGWRPAWPASMDSLGTAEGWRSQQPPALRVWCEGTAWGNHLSLPPSHPVWPSLGCGAGSRLWAQSCPTPPGPHRHPTPFPRCPPSLQLTAWRGLLLSPPKETWSWGGWVSCSLPGVLQLAAPLCPAPPSCCVRSFF